MAEVTAPTLTVPPILPTSAPVQPTPPAQPAPTVDTTDPTKSFLEGNRTYLTIALALAIIVAQYFNIIDDRLAGLLLTAAGFGGLGFLRSAVGKASAVAPTIDQVQTK